MKHLLGLIPILVLLSACSGTKEAISTSPSDIKTGEYGYNKLNPVETGGINNDTGSENQVEYLNRLTGPNGEPVWFDLLGTDSESELDNGLPMASDTLVAYKVWYPGIMDTAIIYFSPSTNAELKPITGFNLSDEAVVFEADSSWHHQSIQNSSSFGVNTEQAYDEFIQKLTPRKKVKVAIIDSGIDIEHEDLKSVIWINEDEIPGNGIDDDNNGYVDDIHGWNFIGGADGRHVDKDTYEVTRLYKRLSPDYAGLTQDQVPEEQAKEFELFKKVEEEYERSAKRAEELFNQAVNVEQAIGFALQTVGASSVDAVTDAMLEANPNDDDRAKQAKQILTYFREQGLTDEILEFELADMKGRKQYGYNLEFEPRSIVGDDPYDLSSRAYGNNDVVGVHNDHGTHVAGIVGAVRDNGLGIDGVASEVEIMALRAVPDGDERDKDVANAIRYAVENGADIINMSFGKGYSPNKAYVDEAVKFAEKKGVLLVCSAGNSALDIDEENSYPDKYYADGSGTASNWITVGASSWYTGTMVSASFSNFGNIDVDLFAPGVDIMSTIPNNQYEAFNGTSMAAPVVSGVAALILTYYPEFSPSEVISLLMESSTKPDYDRVLVPGSVETAPFSDLSVSGGIVNAYEALKLAKEKAALKP
ncbi:MAG: S8 family peptidase [Bacteroidota bacterium]